MMSFFFFLPSKKHEQRRTFYIQNCPGTLYIEVLINNVPSRGSLLLYLLANITHFQHDNVTSHTARDTVNFLGSDNIYL